MHTQCPKMFIASFTAKEKNLTITKVGIAGDQKIQWNKINLYNVAGLTCIFILDIKYTNFKSCTHIIILHHVHQDTHKPSYTYFFILTILKKDQNIS